MPSRKKFQVGAAEKNWGFFLIPLFTVGFPPIFDMGDSFGECKGNIFLIREIMDRKIPFQKIQPSIYNVCIYLALKYGNVKVYVYLEMSGTSRVATGWRCASGGYSLKDLGNVIHHHVPLILKVLLEQYFDKIFCSLAFLSFRHGRPSGFARLILQRFNQIDP